MTADSSDYASAQFDGYLQVPTAANYTFYITCDDGANLWIDDELVLSQATAGQYETRPILLTGSRLYHLQVMYYERTGFARMRLEWASDQGFLDLQKVTLKYFFFFFPWVTVFPDMGNLYRE